MLNLKPPRHTPTLPTPAVCGATMGASLPLERKLCGDRGIFAGGKANAAARGGGRPRPNRHIRFLRRAVASHIAAQAEEASTKQAMCLCAKPHNRSIGSRCGQLAGMKRSLIRHPGLANHACTSLAWWLAMLHAKAMQQCDQARASLIGDAAFAFDPGANLTGRSRQGLCDPGLEFVLLLARQTAGAALVAEARQPLDPIFLIQAEALSEQRQVVCVGLSKRRPKLRLGREGAPLGQRGGAPLFVNLAGDEMALLIEMVVDLGMN